MLILLKIDLFNLFFIKELALKVVYKQSLFYSFLSCYSNYFFTSYSFSNFSQRHPDDNSLFKEVAEENFFHSFSSHKYYNKNKHDVFLGLKSNGDIKSPRITGPGQKAVMFLYLPVKQTPLTKRTRKVCI